MVQKRLKYRCCLSAIVLLVLLYYFAYDQNAIQLATSRSSETLNQRATPVVPRTRTTESCSCNRKSTHTYHVEEHDLNQRVIAYSLYGDLANRNIQTRYYKQLEKRLKEVQHHFSGWEVWLYHNVSGDDVSCHFCQLKCRYLTKLQFHNMSQPRYTKEKLINPRLWRFLPLLDTNVHTFLSRDLDSPISAREAVAVRQWLNSSFSFHVMRDHPSHGVPILAGTWGAKLHQHPLLVRNLGKLMLAVGRNQHIETDQRFLWIYAWPVTQFDTMFHDSYFCKRWEFNFFNLLASNVQPFPTRREKFNFVGGYGHSGRSTNDTQGLIPCPLECRPSYGRNWTYC